MRARRTRKERGLRRLSLSVQRRLLSVSGAEISFAVISQAIPRLERLPTQKYGGALSVAGAKDRGIRRASIKEKDIREMV